MVRLSGDREDSRASVSAGKWRRRLRGEQGNADGEVQSVLLARLAVWWEDIMPLAAVQGSLDTFGLDWTGRSFRVFRASQSSVIPADLKPIGARRDDPPDSGATLCSVGG